MKRSQKELICRDLTKKMVFLAGPRQVGKTWLAKDIMNLYEAPVYLNFDHWEDRKIIQAESWLPTADLIVFDEIHKMPNWKNYLKGIYDTKPDHLHILVTGSSRLETFRQSGDSLAGRYFQHRLLPLSYKESSLDLNFPLDFLISRGGFPEPLLAESDEDAQRWRNQYADSLIRNDIPDFENINDRRAIQPLFQMLRSRVGSPISYKSIAEDLGKAPNTIKKYINILEALYIVFRITPFSQNIARSLLKEPKLYFFDTGLVIGDEGLKFENFLAVSLLKHTNYVLDARGINAKLHYLRTKEGREIDFCLVENDTLTAMIEVKHSDSSIDKNFYYFQNKLKISATQVVKHLRKEFSSQQIKVRKAENFLKELEA